MSIRWILYHSKVLIATRQNTGKKDRFLHAALHLFRIGRDADAYRENDLVSLSSRMYNAI